MSRTSEFFGRLLVAVGVAAFAASIVLLPANTAFAQTGSPGCPGPPSFCNTGCHACIGQGCIGAGCGCKQNSPPQCPAACVCRDIDQGAGFVCECS